MKRVSGVATATGYLANLRGHLEHIARLGTSGVPRNKVSHGLRLIVHGRYNIYFRVAPTKTIIVRVVHSRRDVRRLSFHEDPAPPIAPSAPAE